MKADFISLKWPWQAMIPFKNVCIDSYIPVYNYKCFFIRKKNHNTFFMQIYQKAKKKPQEDCT